MDVGRHCIQGTLCLFRQLLLENEKKNHKPEVNISQHPLRNHMAPGLPT